MNKWEKYKETTQILAVLMLDCVAIGFKRYFRDAHDKRTVIERYGQFLNARWMGSNDIENYIAMMYKASTKQLIYWVGEFRFRKERLLVFILKERDYHGMSNSELIKCFSKFVDLSARAYQFAYDYVMLNRFYSEKINGLILKKVKGVESLNKFLPYIAGLEKATDIYKSQKKIGDLAIRVKSNGVDEKIKREIKIFCRKYGYLNMFGYLGEPYSEEEIGKRVWRLAKMTRKEIIKRNFAPLKQLALNKKKTRDFIKNYKLSKEEKLVIKVLKNYIYISMWADELYHKIPYLIRPMIEEIAGRLELSYEQLVFMRFQEIIENLRAGKISKDLIKTINERRQEFAFLLDKGRVKILSGLKLKKFKEKFKEKDDFTGIKELKGQPASPGKTAGLVKIIKNADDIKNFERGIILVAVSTAPMHVPAMERAAAIITDEGGLLSHAAIVSREFKKPCIIGTKIATKVLKDGDLVEVDADKGMVKILKKKKSRT